jgi:type IV pilus assembly protein PilC
MKVYEYTAKNKFGHKLTGTYEDIENAAALREELGKIGYSLVNVRRESRQERRKLKVNSSEVVSFAYKFSEMYSAGLSIVRCLEALEQQTQDRVFKYIISDIRQNVETGSSLSKPFEKYRDIFSDFFIGMIAAGETGGQLAKSLEMSAIYLEKQREVRRKVKSAFAYPIAVCVTCLAVIAVLMIFVIPVFSKMYGQLHVTLPFPTQVLVTASILIRRWWWLLLAVVFGAAEGCRRLFKSRFFRDRWDGFKLKMPVFGRLNQMVAVSNFIRSFALLTSVGVPMIDALDVADMVTYNRKMSDITRELKKAVESGNLLSKTLRSYDIFPPAIIQLALAGEEAGIMPEMLNKGADFLDKDIERTVNSLLVKLEPALTITMGAVIGFLLMSVYLPIFDYMGHLK